MGETRRHLASLLSQELLAKLPKQRSGSRGPSDAARSPMAAPLPRRPALPSVLGSRGRGAPQLATG
eukprot:8947598-Alexandrium_andersonii.AAC.1